MPRVTLNDSQVRPQVGVYSYGAAKGSTAAAGQFEFDVSTFRDPAGQKQFVGLNGTYPAVRDWVALDSRVRAIMNDCLILTDDMIKPKERDGKKPEPISHWISFSFKDHHGTWIAPAVAEAVANAISDAGYSVFVAHKEVPQEKRFPAVLPGFVVA